jgi:hypothetical protein
LFLLLAGLELLGSGGLSLRELLLGLVGGLHCQRL